MAGLGVDHMLVQCEFIFSEPGVRSGQQKLRRPWRRFPHVGKYACRDLSVVHQLAEPLMERAMHGLAVSHKDLQELAMRSTYKVLPLRYQDPPRVEGPVSSEEHHWAWQGES